MSEAERPATPAHFDRSRAATYDAEIEAGLPGYDLLHRTAAAVLDVAAPDAAEILVAGAGTGREMELLAADRPGRRFLAVDPSAPMLEIAARRAEAQGLSGRVAFHCGLLGELVAAPAFDAATLLLVLHFLPDDGTKAALLRDVAVRLRPGAPLVLADLHGDPADPGFALLLDAWQRDQLLRGGGEAELAERFHVIRTALHFISESRLRELLADAGFVRVERFLSAYLCGGWVAFRAERAVPSP